MADGPWWKRAKDRDKKVYAEWQELRTPEGLPYYYNTKTNITTWDKPDALKTEEELANAGDWVWMPDQENCFVPARVVGQGGGQITLQTESGQQATVPANTKLDPLKMASLVRVVADLTLLDNMHVPLILHNLRKRFEDRKIYTNIGTILVSVNPYQKLDLYTPEVIYEYQYRGVKDMPPHVFNVAHDAYRHMGEFGINNSIIISGESGAGKTEATKQCLAYLAAIAGSVSNVEQKILLANPILEAFGNAKTLRNDNSSRFGKYMEVFFNDKRQINGSLTTNYLLEKIRVVKQSQGERNFHIFYQLSKAASAQDRKQLCIGEPGDYNYTALSGCTDVDTIDDAHDFAALKEAFTALSFSAAEQKGVFTIISAILALGNIEFKESGDRKANIPDKAWLDVAAGLLQVAPAALTKSMLIKELKIKGQANTQVSQSMKEASDNRDALGKFIYSEMFNWLVQKVNKAMGQTPKGCKSIGILDIFGFEIFKENSFEQLCINYTNEMLQQHFNQHTFKLEEQLYKQEKIPFKHIEFIDNQPVLDLIEQKGVGILPLLDEELVMPKGSDATFLGKMHNAHAKNKNYQKVLKNPQQFVIVHYAGQVCYDTIGFLEKNRDTLTDDLLEMVCGSKLPLLNELFPKATLQMSTKDKKASLAKQFSRQLHDLMSTLNNTEPHYIRCVKPNPNKSACTFVPRMVFEQLTYSGVFEAVAIRKQGYPFRLTHKIFYERYRCILKNPDQKFNNDKAGCEGIIKEMKLNMQNVQMGTTMCLYRSDEYKALELQYGIKVEKIRMNEQLKALIARNPNEMKDAERDKFFEELSRAVMKADEFNLQSDIANKARKLLDDFIESRMDDDTRALLNAAKDEVNEEKLIEALAICDQNEYATKLVKECRRLLKRIQRINEEANKAIEILEELPMQVVLDAADEIKLSNQSVEYIREVLSCPKETLIKMQMGVATRMKDNARAIRITIRLKDLMFQKMQGSDMFDIKHYGKLKQAAEWNNEKFFSFLGSEARQEGMLKWTKDSIHSPLTDIKHPDPKVVKKLKGEVTTTFKMIQKYMGDRKDKDDVGTGREVVAMGLANPPLRDEIYMQTIKQLTDNPDAGSIRKGWMLMGLCLTTFPPGNDFENFLEVFLRKYAQPAAKYVGALHKIVFEGEMKRPPTLEEMIKVEETLTTRARGFSEPLPPAQPSYQDLLEKYHQMDKITNEYERKAPKAAEKAKKPGPKKPEAKKAPAKKNPWIEAQDPSSGQTYYYNEETGESTWDRPPELDPIMSRISVVGQRW